MKKLLQFTLVLLLTQPLYSQEFLIREETFTWTSAEDSYFGGNGFHWWRDYSAYPYSWTSPYDYFHGRIYYRYEVISQPTSKSFSLMYLIWQYQEDGKHRETGDDRVPVQGGAGAVTEYNNAPSPSKWWSYFTNADQLVDFSKIGAYSNNGDNRMGLALWSDTKCIPSSWGGTSKDFCNDRKPDYFPMKLRMTIVAVAEGHTFSGWDKYLHDDEHISFIADYSNEKTKQEIPTHYEYSFDQTSWTKGTNVKLDITPGKNIYFRKTGSTTVQTLNIPTRPSTPAFTIDYLNENTAGIVDNTFQYSIAENFTNSTNGNGNKISLSPGQKVYIRKKHSIYSFRSNAQTLNVPNRPVITSDAGDTVTTKPFLVTVTFPSTVTGFTNSDLVTTNATVKTVSESFKASIEPVAPGNINIRVSANAVNEGNFSSQALSVHYKTATGIDQTSDNTKVIYPNPAKDFFNINNELSKNNESCVSIYNSVGRKVSTQILCTSVSQVNIQSLPAGIYFVEINNGKHMSRNKLIIE